MINKIIFDFGDIQLEAELFKTRIADKLIEELPREMKLTHWGQEMYGCIDINMGVEEPVDEVPPGGIAYTNNGNYLCLFYGQKPAWPVEHIGRLTGNWRELLTDKLETVTVRKKD